VALSAKMCAGPATLWELAGRIALPVGTAWAHNARVTAVILIAGAVSSIGSGGQHRRVVLDVDFPCLPFVFVARFR
jgi:hypothetical protein